MTNRVVDLVKAVAVGPRKARLHWEVSCVFILAKVHRAIKHIAWNFYKCVMISTKLMTAISSYSNTKVLSIGPGSCHKLNGRAHSL